MSPMTWPPNALAAGTHPANAPDKDEAGGSSPPRPTTLGLTCGNAIGTAVLDLGPARRYSTLPAAGVAVGCCSTVGTDRLPREHHSASGTAQMSPVSPARRRHPGSPGPNRRCCPAIPVHRPRTRSAPGIPGSRPGPLRQEAPVGWELADEEAEGGGSPHPAAQVDHRHVELKEVGQQPAAAVALPASLCTAHPSPRPARGRQQLAVAPSWP